MDSEFEVTGGKIIVSDPCYDASSDCNYFAKVENGVWVVKIIYDNERPKELISYVRDVEISDEWEKITSDICVDSGLVGFYDLTHFQDNKIIENLDEYYNEGIEKLFPEQVWFSANYGVSKTKQGGVIPFGCVVKTPYSTGCYDLYILQKQSEIIALRLVLFD